EKVYNPFYGLLGVHLCSYNHNFALTFQFSFWDRFKQIDTYPVKKISHLAKLLLHLVVQGSLSLVVLRVRLFGLNEIEFFEVIDFPKLSPKNILFFRLFFTDLILKNSEEVVHNLFSKIHKLKDVTASLALKEGIAYFFLQEELHNKVASTLTQEEKQT